MDSKVLETACIRLEDWPSMWSWSQTRAGFQLCNCPCTLQAHQGNYQGEQHPMEERVQHGWEGDTDGGWTKRHTYQVLLCSRSRHITTTCTSILYGSPLWVLRLIRSLNSFFRLVAFQATDYLAVIFDSGSPLWLLMPYPALSLLSWTFQRNNWSFSTRSWGSRCNHIAIRAYCDIGIGNRDRARFLGHFLIVGIVTAKIRLFTSSVSLRNYPSTNTSL